MVRKTHSEDPISLVSIVCVSQTLCHCNKISEGKKKKPKSFLLMVSDVLVHYGREGTVDHRSPHELCLFPRFIPSGSPAYRMVPPTFRVNLPPLVNPLCKFSHKHTSDVLYYCPRPFQHYQSDLNPISSLPTVVNLGYQLD
jgi:hypothetical protein